LRILVSWLRELVDVPASIDALAAALHMAGFELAGIEPPPAGVPNPSGADDAVIDVEITANRPDCLSITGIAREVSVLYGGELRCPARGFVRAGHDRTAGPLRVTIESPDLCPRYTAALADVRIGPSPAWLSARLTAAGVRSINNIVDVTNDVLMETGHPLHAFDLEKLAGPHLRIRRARPGETLVTLDGQTRTLTDDMLVIADADRAQALGGIMGGAESEVSASTRIIALESAYFHPPTVRRTSKRLGLSTEASYRFERGADPEAPPLALARACELIEQIGAGRARAEWIDAYPTPRTPVAVTLRHSRITRLLGFSVPADDVRRILRGLGFGLDHVADADRLEETHEQNGSEPGPVWRVEIPSWRGDVSREADLIEEVARHYGYDRIPTTFPALTVMPPGPDVRLVRDEQVRAYLRAAGFSEAVTFAFIDRAAAATFADEPAVVTIANPLSETFAVLRPMLLPGVLGSVGHNRRREQRDVRLFELANRFDRERGEHRAVGLVWTGDASEHHWSGSGRSADAFDLAGLVTGLCDVLSLEAELVPEPLRYFVSQSSTSIAVRPRDADQSIARRVGIAGQIAPAVLEAFGLPGRDAVFAAELDLDALLDWNDPMRRRRASAPPRFPSIVRDISIVVRNDLPAAAVRGTIRRAAPDTLESVREFDRYQGKGVADGHCSLSIRLTFRATNRTLTDAEAQAAMDAIVYALAREHGATLR
jgi:phenylalanyl-tRNA synthetase beta chain